MSIYKTPLFDSLFNTFESDLTPRSNTSFNKEENGYLFTIDLVGVNKEDIKTRIENNIITIEATRKKGEKVIRKYDEAYKLPSFVSTKDISANYENGVLGITFQESKENTQEIEIK